MIYNEDEENNYEKIIKNSDWMYRILFEKRLKEILLIMSEGAFNYDNWRSEGDQERRVQGRDHS